MVCQFPKQCNDGKRERIGLYFVNNANRRQPVLPLTETMTLVSAPDFVLSRRSLSVSQRDIPAWSASKDVERKPGGHLFRKSFSILIKFGRVTTSRSRRS